MTNIVDDHRQVLVTKSVGDGRQVLVTNIDDGERQVLMTKIVGDGRQLMVMADK